MLIIGLLQKFTAIRDRLAVPAASNMIDQRGILSAHEMPDFKLSMVP
jgi:hypothetical protein